jgi:hypothetical protein
MCWELMECLLELYILSCFCKVCGAKLSFHGVFESPPPHPPGSLMYNLFYCILMKAFCHGTSLESLVLESSLSFRLCRKVFMMTLSDISHRTDETRLRAYANVHNSTRQMDKRSLKPLFSEECNPSIDV